MMYLLTEEEMTALVSRKHHQKMLDELDRKIMVADSYFEALEVLPQEMKLAYLDRRKQILDKAMQAWEAERARSSPPVSGSQSSPLRGDAAPGRANGGVSGVETAQDQGPDV